MEKYLKKRKKKRIILHGYLHDANFGDILFAHLFYDRCKKLGFDEIDFFQYKYYGIGPFCRRELGYDTEKTLFSCLKSDAFVLISGGSLWDDASIPGAAKLRFKRFILPARLFQLLRKPVYVLGVGGGSVDTEWLRREMVRMLNKAAVIQFRDEETLKVFRSYGVKNEMSATADTALVLTKDMLSLLNEKKELDAMAKQKKKLLLHIPDGLTPCTQLADVVTPGLVRFLINHPDYLVVISHDNIRPIGEYEEKEISNIKKQLQDAGIPIFEYKYHDCLQMCSLIGEMDCVVSLKLHVGVVGAALGKCVVSFPVHREKTNNFYAMIGESERCLHTRELTSDAAFEQLERFHNKPIAITPEMRMAAESNLDALAQIINGRKNGRKKKRKGNG